VQIAGKFIEKSSCEYGVGRKNINMKKHIFMSFHLGMGYVNFNLELYSV
jgi:hypothetical protein